MTATTTQLNSTNNSCYYGTSCVLLESNKIFIAHAYSSSYYLYGTIVEINGTTMTATTTELNSTSKSCYESPSCVLLENNKVFITHCVGMAGYLYGTIVEIDETSMTATSNQLDNKDVHYSSSCLLLEQNKVFVAYAGSSYDYLYGIVVEINETTMTATSKALVGISQSCKYSPSCVLLENNKVFIAHSYGNSYYLYGTVVQINGTEMTPTTTELNSSLQSCYIAPSCVLLESNKVFIAHAYSNSYYLYGTIVDVNGTSMTATIKFTTTNSYSNNKYSPSCVLLENNKVFIAHSYGNSYYLYATLYFGNEAVSTTDTIKGVAKTSGTEGQTIQVYVPNK